MKVLIVGGGGREHAIAQSVAKSEKVDKIYCTPGNAGIAALAECAPIGAMEFDKIVAFAKEKEVDLVIVGMDDPLVGGLVDELEAAGIRAFGPKKNAAILEGSKAFSKDLMKKYNIPTAAYEKFTDPDAAIKYLETEAKFPIVLKADGLALGKGVLICNTLEEAKDGVKEIMLDKKFGSAGNEMVIEEFMTGREVSVLSFVDGNTIKTMTSAQDHKRAGDGDTGLNTGGMGTFSPSPFYTKEVEDFCNKYVYQGKNKLGFLGGMAVPAVIRYGYGFVQGADAAAQELGQNIEINYFYGGQFYGDANITSRMEGWYSNGTQVVFACGGGIYTSAVEAALKNNGYVIGVDVDQNYIGANGVADGTYAYNPFITSAMKGLSAAVETALTDIEGGEWSEIAATNGNFGLEDGDYIGLPTDDDSWNFESFTKDEYEAVKAKIASGEIAVDNSSDDATKPTVSELTTVTYIQ